MPAKSKAQAKLMNAAAHNPSFAKKVGIKPSVAKDFTATKGEMKGLPARAGAKRGKRS